MLSITLPKLEGDRSALQILTEGGDDSGVYEIDHLLEQWKHRLTLDNLRLVNRYIESGLEFLVHYIVDGIDEEWIARFQRARILGGSEISCQVDRGQAFGEVREVGHHR